MEAKELNPKDVRIGNLVKPIVGELEHIAEITAINSYNVCVDLVDENYEEYLSTTQELKYKHIQPIPITEELLLRVEGFVRIENNWKVLDLVCFKISWERLAGIVLTLGTESIYLPHIKYLHQLQNLCQDLGHELTLKDNLNQPSANQI